MLIDRNSTATRRSAKRVAAEPTFASAAAQRTARELLDEIIRVRAYELYLARGDADGSATEDWLQAEREYLGDNADLPAAVRQQTSKFP